MLQASIIRDTSLSSTLKEASHLKLHKEKTKKVLMASLMLTSLIDAFSILLIFVLMNSSQTGEFLYVNKDMILPSAVNAKFLERDTIVKIDNGRYFVEEQEVTVENLVAKLLEVHTQFKKDRPGETFPGVLVIQADKRTPYQLLNNLVMAGNQTGYGEIRFATLAP